MSIAEGITPPVQHGPSLGSAYADARQRLTEFVASTQAETRELRAAIGMAAVALGLKDQPQILDIAEAMELMEKIGGMAEKWLACCDDIGNAPSAELTEHLVADRRRRVQERLRPVDAG